MELRHLRYFVAVAEEEHFGRAARRLHVSQPPLSRQIRQLEEEIGVELFAHAGRGVRLTAAGRALLDGARATLAESHAAVRAAQRAARGVVGNLRVAFVDNPTFARIVPEVMARMRDRHPDVSFELSVMPTAAQWDALRERRIDAGFCYYGPDDPGVRAEVVAVDRVVVALPRRHRLATRRRLRARDLSGEPFVWFPRNLSPRFHDHVVGALQAKGASLDVVAEGTGDAARLSMVASGMGLTFVVESARSVGTPHVVFRAVDDVDLDVEALVVWRAGDEGSPLVASLLATARALRRKVRASR